MFSLMYVLVLYTTYIQQGNLQNIITSFNILSITAIVFTPLYTVRYTVTITVVCRVLKFHEIFHFDEK